MPVMLDGDIFPAAPLHTKLSPEKTRVVVPRA